MWCGVWLVLNGVGGLRYGGGYCGLMVGGCICWVTRHDGGYESLCECAVGL